MVKVLKKTLEDDLKAKELFQKKLDYLQEKKQKALASRRSTLNRRKRKREADEVPKSRGAHKRKRVA